MSVTQDTIMRINAQLDDNYEMLFQYVMSRKWSCTMNNLGSGGSING
jgi:hypothetical protein